MTGEQFWASAVKSDDGCWLWGRSRGHHDYGRATVRGIKERIAHRVAWRLYYGVDILAGLIVCHRCDRPPCINPEHLFLGTHSDNIRDRDEKGRGAWCRGEHGRAKLTNADVLAIRKMLSSGRTFRNIAPEFGVSRWAISRAARSLTWRHLDKQASA